MSKITYLAHVFIVFNFILLTFCDNSISLCNQRSQYLCKCFSNMEINIDCHKRGINTIENASLPVFAHKFDLSRNNISVIESFLKSSTLKILLLNNNKIEYIDSGVFKGIKNLDTLDLSHNQISNLSLGTFHGITHLKHLNMANNNIKKFDTQTFLYLPLLRSLNLNYNDLGDYFIESSDVFEVDGLSVNHRLEELYIKNNSVTKLNDMFFNNAYGLKTLDLSENGLTSVPKLPDTIQYLDISSTPIATLKEKYFERLPLLTHLKANHMSMLIDIENNTFAHTNVLESLYLEDCKKLQNFNSYSFGTHLINDTDFENVTLKQVSFLGSGLLTLEKHLSLIFWNLTLFDIRGNPWICDCHITWILHTKMNEKWKENIRCYYPRQLEYQRMWEVDEKYFTCPIHLDVLHWLIVYGLVIMCIMLLFLSLWLIFLWPKRNSATNPLAAQSAYTEITLEPNRAEHY